MHRSGLLLVATTSRGFDSYLTVFRELRSLGYESEFAELSADEAAALEPTLAARRLAGGVHTTVDRYVRPETLTEGLARHLSAAGVDVRRQVEVSKLVSANGHVRVETTEGVIEADRVVVAAGASSSPLLAQLGVRMPLVGARGYSFTFAGGDTRPSQALYLAEAKVGISSYDDSVRVAGVFELGRRSDRLDRGRVQAMLASVEPYFGVWRPGKESALLEWAGLRPVTADGLPLIGRAPSLPNAFVATGHGMLGVTLAPATAALLAPLVLEDRTAPELAPFDPGRQ